MGDNSLAYVCHEYQERLCVMMSRGAFLEIKEFHSKGLESELIILAIEKAVQKGAKWSYAKTILDRCIEEGIFKKETFEYRANFKRVNNSFKKRFSSLDDNLLLLFTLIEISRDYLKEIEEKLSAITEADPFFNINDYMADD